MNGICRKIKYLTMEETKEGDILLGNMLFQPLTKLGSTEPDIYSAVVLPTGVFFSTSKIDKRKIYHIMKQLGKFTSQEEGKKNMEEYIETFMEFFDYKEIIFIRRINIHI